MEYQDLVSQIEQHKAEMDAKTREANQIPLFVEIQNVINNVTFTFNGVYNFFYKILYPIQTVEKNVVRNIYVRQWVGEKKNTNVRYYNNDDIKGFFNSGYTAEMLKPAFESEKKFEIFMDMYKFLDSLKVLRRRHDYDIDIPVKIFKQYWAVLDKSKAPFYQRELTINLKSLMVQIVIDDEEKRFYILGSTQPRNVWSNNKIEPFQIHINGKHIWNHTAYNPDINLDRAMDLNTMIGDYDKLMESCPEAIAYIKRKLKQANDLQEQWKALKDKYLVSYMSKGGSF